VTAKEKPCNKINWFVEMMAKEEAFNKNKLVSRDYCKGKTF